MRKTRRLLLWTAAELNRVVLYQMNVLLVLHKCSRDRLQCFILMLNYVKCRLLQELFNPQSTILYTLRPDEDLFMFSAQSNVHSGLLLHHLTDAYSHVNQTRVRLTGPNTSEVNIVLNTLERPMMHFLESVGGQCWVPCLRCGSGRQ